MIILLSPAKKLNKITTYLNLNIGSKPLFIEKSEELVNSLKKMDAKELATTLSISDTLANLNEKRYKEWSIENHDLNGKRAIDLFAGDAYQHLKFESLDDDSKKYVYKSLYILSGLYGAIKPQDIILPYRLEMGIKLPFLKNKNKLYGFWENEILKMLNNQQDEIVVNLASKEYSKVVNFDNLNKKVYHVEFYETKNDNFSQIGIFSKQARGMCVKCMAENKIQQIQELKKFNKSGYKFNQKISTENKLCFTR